jgi:ABC-type multidrug transport system ATPase subunit
VRPRQPLSLAERTKSSSGFFDAPTERPRELLERLDLPLGDRRTTVAQYSKGMKVCLVVARSLMNPPRFWFLDKSTAGQDPEHAV